MRTLFILLFLCLGHAVVSGQVAPKPVPSLPPPPPPPSPTVGAGFQLLKIPVTGNYYLGMTRTEYDSIKSISPLTLKTDKTEYTVTQSTLFTGKRLSMLSLSIDSNYAAPPADIMEMYIAKLGEPEGKEAIDTTWNLPDANDPAMKVDYEVKKSSLTWNFQYHDISINIILVNLRNGNWRCVHTIRYTGNTVFKGMLKNLEQREGN